MGGPVPWRFAVEDLRRAPGEALLLLAFAMATTDEAAKGGGATVFPAPRRIALVVLDDLVAVTALAAVPSRPGGRRPAAKVLQVGAA